MKKRRASGCVTVTGPPRRIWRSKSGTTEPSLPSTLPKRTAAKRVWLRPERLCMSISHTRLAAPITLVGFTALSVEMSTNLPTQCRSAASSRLRVPTTLFSTASRGLASSSGTCLCAAAWNTTVGRNLAKACSTASASRMSATTACMASDGYWETNSLWT